MTLRSLVRNDVERRPRAPVRLVVGFLLIATLGVVGTVAAELLAGAVWPSRPQAYVLVGSTLGLAAGAAAGVVVVARLLDRRPVTDYGFRGGRAWWRDAAAGAGLAIGIQATILGVALAAGWAVVVDGLRAGPEGIVLAVVASVVLFAVVGVYEELVVRGFVLKNVAEGTARYGSVPAVAAAVVVSSLLFGGVHLLNAGASLVSTAVIAVIAVTLGAGYVLTGRLGLAVGFHAAWNVAMGVLFGQPVSGLVPPAQLLVVEATGPAAWTGGAFGLEAGLLGVLGAVAGLAGVVAYARLVEGRVRVHPSVLVPDLRTAGTDARAAVDAGGSERDVEVDATAPGASTTPPDARSR